VRILHLDEQTGWRGGEQQASWLVQGLAERGHDVWVVGRRGSPFLAGNHGGAQITRLSLPLRGEFDLYSAWCLARLCARESIDIVHAHSSHAHGIAVLAGRLSGKSGPKIIAARRVSFPPKGHRLNRWKYAQPDRIVCVSYKVAEVMREFGTAGDQLTVVHSAVDLARVSVDPLSRAELGVPEHVPLVVSAGSLVGHKDHANLLDAVALVRESVPDLWLLIAGDGPLRADLEKRAAHLHLTDRVRFLGQRKDAPRLIRAGTVYVSSSASEGLGTSILEALASGIPVVATRAGGADEMVIPGRTGWLVPVRDAVALGKAIVECLQHRDEALRMAAEGRCLIEDEFTAPRMVERTLAVYAQLLQGVL
jgi:glycosyltransferase involved in cell wall biosynthesis